MSAILSSATQNPHFLPRSCPRSPAPSVALRRQTEAMLKDMAFVLHLSRSVKESMTRPTAPTR